MTCSRRQAEQWIQAGRVRVNGQIAVLGQRVDQQRDTITVDGTALGQAPARQYILLHKPRGYVTTLKDERGRKTVADLVQDCGARVYPVAVWTATRRGFCCSPTTERWPTG